MIRVVAGIAFFVVLDVPIRRRCKRLNLGIELREEQRDMPLKLKLWPRKEHQAYLDRVWEVLEECTTRKAPEPPRQPNSTPPREGLPVRA